MKEWLKRNSYNSKDVTLVNFDVGSSIDAISEGRALCQKHNIIFEVADNPAIQLCFKRAVELAKELSIDWVVYQQQDTWSITSDFYSRLSNRLGEIGFKKEIGFVGVNIYHDSNDIKQLDHTKKWMTPSRCLMQIGDGWYRRKTGTRAKLDAFEQKDFLTESIFWVLGACHITTFDNVEVDDRFEFILGFDDMIFQLLLKNKYQLVLCDLDLAHDQSMKEGTGIQKKSTVAAESLVKKFYGRTDYREIWIEKHGFEFNFQKHYFNFNNKLFGRLCSRIVRIMMPNYFSGLDSVLRYGYKNNEKVSRSELTEKFYNHDPKLGPIMYLEEL